MLVLPIFPLPRLKKPQFPLPRLRLPRFPPPRFRLPKFPLPRFKMPLLPPPRFQLPMLPRLVLMSGNVSPAAAAPATEPATWPSPGNPCSACCHDANCAVAVDTPPW